MSSDTRASASGRASFADMMKERKENRRSQEELAAKKAAAVDPPLREHPVYGKYFQMAGLYKKAEIIMEMRKNGHDTKILDMDPDVPYVDPNAPVDEEPEDAMSPKTKRGVKAIFDVFDTRKEGMLSTVTLGAAFHKLGVAYKPELVKLAMDEFDLDGNGMLDFGEFMELLAMMQESAELTPEPPPQLHKFKDDEVKQLRKSFEEFDRDGGGNLDKEEIVLAAQSSGMDDVTEEDIRMMLDKFDANGDGNMDFDEFLTMMSALDTSRATDSAAEGAARGADAIQNLIRENLKRAREKGRKSDRVRQVGVSAAIKQFELDEKLSLAETADTAMAATKAAGGDADDCKKAHAEAHATAIAFLNKKILEAAEKGPAAQIKASVARGGDANCVALDEELHQAPALMVALKANRKDEALALLECGADAGKADTRGETALIAASAGHAVAQPNVLEKLINAGGNLDAATDRGVGPIHAAASFGRTEALTHLLKKCGATFPRKEGDPPPPAQLEVGTVDGLTPIMKAAQMGQQQSVELLIKFGAEVNAVDNQAMSALDWAEKTDRKPIVDVLKKANGERGAIIKRKQREAAQKAAKAEAAAPKEPTGNAVAPSG